MSLAQAEAASPLETTLVFILLPMVALIAGGALALFHTPGDRLRSYAQHLAAGLVFAAVSVELLPEITRKSPIAVLAGFALGTALMLTLKWLTGKIGPVEEVESAGHLSLLASIGVDVVVDGLLIGLGFATGVRQGVLLALAVGIEDLFLGLATSTALKHGGASTSVILGSVVGLALLIAFSAVVGVTLFSGLTGLPLTVALALGSAALLYLVVEELLVEAHEITEGPISAAMFFVGFGLLFVIEGVL